MQKEVPASRAAFQVRIRLSLTYCDALGWLMSEDESVTLRRGVLSDAGQQWLPEGVRLAFALCPMANGLLRASCFFSLPSFFSFMWHQWSLSSVLLSGEHHSVLHFLPPSGWALSKHIEGRLHLEYRELSDLTVLPSFSLRSVSRSHFKPGIWF